MRWRRSGDLNEFDKKVLKHTKWVIISIRIYISILSGTQNANKSTFRHLHSVGDIPVHDLSHRPWRSHSHTNCVNSLPFHCHFVFRRIRKMYNLFFPPIHSPFSYQAHWFNGIFCWIFFSRVILFLSPLLPLPFLVDAYGRALCVHSRCIIMSTFAWKWRNQMLHKLNVQSDCDNWRVVWARIRIQQQNGCCCSTHTKGEQRSEREKKEISLAVTLYYVPFFVCGSTSLSLSNRSLNYLASRCHFQFCLVCDILLHSFALFFFCCCCYRSLARSNSGQKTI